MHACFSEQERAVGNKTGMKIAAQDLQGEFCDYVLDSFARVAVADMIACISDIVN
jgi:hypothetical protein